MGANKEIHREREWEVHSLVEVEERGKEKDLKRLMLLMKSKMTTSILFVEIE